MSQTPEFLPKCRDINQENVIGQRNHISSHITRITPRSETNVRNIERPVFVLEFRERVHMCHLCAFLSVKMKSRLN